MQRYLSVLIALLLTIAIPMPSAMAKEPGVNTEPILTGTNISSITHDDVTRDNQPWNFSIELSDDAIANGTTIDSVQTQFCVNQGLCLSPVNMELTNEGNNWSGQIIPHWEECTYTELECLVTYINWRVKLSDGQGNLSIIPESGYYSTWSTCWVSKEILEDGTQEVVEGGEECPTQNEDEGFFSALSGFTTIIAISGIIGAAVITRRVYD